MHFESTQSGKTWKLPDFIAKRVDDVKVFCDKHRKTIMMVALNALACLVNPTAYVLVLGISFVLSYKKVDIADKIATFINANKKTLGFFAAAFNALDVIFARTLFVGGVAFMAGRAAANAYQDWKSNSSSNKTNVPFVSTHDTDEFSKNPEESNIEDVPKDK